MSAIRWTNADRLFSGVARDAEYEGFRYLRGNTEGNRDGDRGDGSYGGHRVARFRRGPLRREKILSDENKGKNNTNPLCALPAHHVRPGYRGLPGPKISDLCREGWHSMNTQSPPVRGSIGELTVYFLRLGLLGFGGPVALVGQMERELVAERRWLSNEQMRESIAICQSLPGPLAIQVGIFISYLRGGFLGAWAGGWAFILPNFLIVCALGALYVHFGGLPPVTAIFYGVSPAVIALIVHSCYRLAKLGMEDVVQWVIAAGCLAITAAVQAEVALLFVAAGFIGAVYYRSPRRLADVSVLGVLGGSLTRGAVVAWPASLGK